MAKRNKRPVKPDLATTIAALKAGNASNYISTEIAYGLSGLTTREVNQVAAMWTELDPVYRYKVMQRMAESSEADFEMDYQAMGMLGLEDRVPEVRAAAIDVLFADESLDLMYRLIALVEQDDSLAVRIAAITALGRFILLGEYGDLPEEETVKAQTLALHIYRDEAEDSELRRRALEAAANSSNDAVPNAIKQAYRSMDSRMRVSAVFAMGRTCDDRWSDEVITEMDSEDPEMRFEAARAAGEIELEEAVPRLGRLLIEDDREVQEMAIWSLGEIGGREALRMLQAVLEVAEENEDDELITVIEDAIATASLASSELFPSWADED